MIEFSDFEIEVLSGCIIDDFRKMVRAGLEWGDAAEKLTENGLLKKYPHPLGATYWSTYSITPQGLLFLKKIGEKNE